MVVGVLHAFAALTGKSAPVATETKSPSPATATLMFSSAAMVFAPVTSSTPGSKPQQSRGDRDGNPCGNPVGFL
jgi:hypothetical protein